MDRMKMFIDGEGIREVVDADEYQAEIDELVEMLRWCDPIAPKKTQYEALMDKHRGK